MSRKRVMIEIIDQWHMAQLCTNSSGWLVLQTLLALNILVFRKENFNRESQAVERSRRKEDLVGQKSQQQPRCQVERERERERETTEEQYDWTPGGNLCLLAGYPFLRQR